MTDLSLHAPISRREFYFGLLAVWLFLLLLATSAVRPDSDWRDLVLPLGALGMLMLHAAALWRGTRRERASGGGAR